jgi:hypothetical protein
MHKFLYGSKVLVHSGPHTGTIGVVTDQVIGDRVEIAPCGSGTSTIVVFERNVEFINNVIPVDIGRFNSAVEMGILGRLSEIDQTAYDQAIGMDQEEIRADIELCKKSKTQTVYNLNDPLECDLAKHADMMSDPWITNPSEY